MKKPIIIPQGTEFVLHKSIYTYTIKDNLISLKRVGDYNGKGSKVFVPPTLDEVKAYFKSEGYNEASAIKFHKSYSANEWKDSNDKLVKGWKQKAINVWFTEQNKAIIIDEKESNNSEEMVM